MINNTIEIIFKDLYNLCDEVQIRVAPDFFFNGVKVIAIAITECPSSRGINYVMKSTYTCYFDSSGNLAYTTYNK